MSPPAKDSLNLTADQQKTAWNDLSDQAKKQTAPPSFFRAVGTGGALSAHAARRYRLTLSIATPLEAFAS
jgi:hypothetical protein